MSSCVLTWILQFRQHIPFRHLDIYWEIDLGPGKPADEFIADLDFAEEIDECVFILHLPGLTIHEGPQRGDDMRRVRMAHFEKPDTLSGMIIPRRHFFRECDHPSPFGDD